VRVEPDVARALETAPPWTARDKEKFLIVPGLRPAQRFASVCNP